MRETHTSSPWDLLHRAGTVLTVHAHPDDESLATGALLADCAARGIRTVLLTATRGEEGEVVPGAVAADDPRTLDEVRAQEIDRAAAALGIAERHLLGIAPALAADAEPRVYRDSGMSWVREGLAGPSPEAGPDCFSRRPLEQAADDLVALISHVRPDVVLSYDDAGSYGHPDHVRAHQVTAAACARTALPMLEVASGEAPPSERGPSERGPDQKGENAPGAAFDWRSAPDTVDVVAEALDAYRTQVTVLGRVVVERDGEQVPGVRVRHVGGQADQILMRTGLRRGS